MDLVAFWDLVFWTDRKILPPLANDLRGCLLIWCGVVVCMLWLWWDIRYAENILTFGPLRLFLQKSNAAQLLLG